MWATLLAALGLLAANGQQVVVRQLAGQTAGLPSAEVMPVGHVLSMASDADGNLVSRYCVDLTCQTVLTATLQTGVAQGEPHVRADPSNARPPMLAFQYKGGQTVAFGRCADQTCQRLQWVRDAVQAAGQDRFEGGVALALGSRGALHLLYRRVFPGVVAQCMLVQCRDVDEPSVPCVSHPVGPGVVEGVPVDEGSEIGPDSVALLPDESLAVVWRRVTPQKEALVFCWCPAAAAGECWGEGARVLEDTAQPQGRLSNAVAIHRGFPLLLYSLGPDESAVLRLVQCDDGNCTSFSAVSLSSALPANGAAFASRGLGLVLALASNTALWRLDCFDVLACEPHDAQLVLNVSQNAALVPESLGASSGGGLQWAAQLRDSAGRLYVAVQPQPPSKIAVCDGQGLDLAGCKGLHESCAAGGAVGAEGSCVCLPGSMPHAGTGLSTPWGCCLNCEAELGKECWQGACECVGGPRDGTGARDGAALSCKATSAPAGVSAGAVAGAAVGSLLAAGVAAAVVFLALRYRARARTSYLTSTASFGDVGASLRGAADSRDEEAPPEKRPAARAEKYDEEDEYSAHDFI